MKKRMTIILLALVMALLTACGNQKEKLVSVEEGGTLVCVGDSITYGLGVMKTRDTDSYPALLQTLLGEQWEVLNCGNPGSTVMVDTNKPYTDQEEYQTSLNAEGDVYLIMLGTNDSKADFWNKEQFVTEYTALVKRYQEQNPEAQIFLMQPLSIYPEDSGNLDNYAAMQKNVDEQVLEAVETVAEETKTAIIDLHTFTVGQPDWYSDGLHPNKTGNWALAQYIFQQITGQEMEIEILEQEVLPAGTTVGCVGDSTTYGSGVMKTRDTESYPALLQQLLGEYIAVHNYGMGSQTVMSGTDAPYREHSIYPKSQSEPCQLYLIMLGTNDAKNSFWNPERFKSELQSFVESYQALETHPEIYLMTPVTVYVPEGEDDVRYDINREYLDQAAEIVREVAEAMDLPLIDIHSLTTGPPEWSPDGVHPALEGNRAIAQAVYDALAMAN